MAWKEALVWRTLVSMTTHAYALVKTGGTGKISSTFGGAANSLATLDGSGLIPLDQIPADIVASLNYQGAWNASTNSPDVGATSPTEGDFYKVSVAGSTSLGGISTWEVGDLAIYNGAAWERIPAGGVATFNGRAGAVVPVAGDYDGLDLNLSGASSFRVPSSAGAAPTTASSVAYDSTAKHLKVGDGTLSLTVIDSSSIGVSVQAYSAVLDAYHTNGAPSAWGKARLLDADLTANLAALELSTAVKTVNGYDGPTVSLDATDVVAIPDVHTDDDQIIYYSGGWLTASVGTVGLAVLAAGTEAAARGEIGLSSFVGAYSSRPAQGAGFKLYHPTDGYTPWVDDGANWRPVYPGGRVGTAPRTAATLTASPISGSTATAADDAGAVVFSASSADSLWTVETVGSSDFDRRVFFFLSPGVIAPAGGKEPLFGFAFRNSTTGIFERRALYWTAGNIVAEVHDYASRGVSAAPPRSAINVGALISANALIGFRAVRDTTNITTYLSMDGGKHWTFLFASLKAVYVAADEVCYFVADDNSQGTRAVLIGEESG